MQDGVRRREGKALRATRGFGQRSGCVTKYRPPAPDRRKTRLDGIRTLKMAASAHAYVRGSTVKFYDWLEGPRHGTVPDGPPVWICGDCHVGNLGPIASTSDDIDIQIRDLDQTVIGNPAHDLIRLGLSLAMAARSSDLPGVTTAHIVEQMAEGYIAALAQPGAADDARAPDIVRRALRRAEGRSWKHLADERIEGCAPSIPLGKRFWPLAKSERTALEDIFARDDARRLVTSLRSRDDASRITVLDAAYWRKGCSSLGRLRYAVLLAIDDGGRGKDPIQHCLIDVKEAVTAAAPSHAGSDMPRDHAARVVQGAAALAPHLGRRMMAAQMLGRSVFIRELRPQDLKLDIESLSRGEAMQVARYLAGVVGTAHGRQMAAGPRDAWRRELVSRNHADLDAPPWLWSSIVDLVGLHEAAYLEHCRRYALAARGTEAE
jgi:uncharacterized protein (DUF2252 family)